MKKGLKMLISDRMTDASKCITIIREIYSDAKEYSKVSACSEDHSDGDRLDAERMVKMLSQVESSLLAIRNLTDNVCMMVDDEEIDDSELNYDDDAELIALERRG